MRALGCVLFVAAAIAVSGTLARAADEPEAIFERARNAWLVRTEAPFVTYGVDVRFARGGRMFDDWYQDSYRTSDARLAVRYLPLPEDAQRYKGFVFSIFGERLFDSNPDSVPVTIAPPAVPPGDSFGIAPPPTPAPLPPVGLPPKPEASPLREIGRVEARERDYSIELVGEETLQYGDAFHLRLTPLRDPKVNRLRELWIAKDGAITLRAVVAGIFSGKPYDTVDWTIDYLPLDGRYYVQEVRAMAPLRFSEVTYADVRFDFVDYRFPDAIPDYTFETPRSFGK